MSLDLHVFRTLSDNAGALLARPRQRRLCRHRRTRCRRDARLPRRRTRAGSSREILITHAHFDHTQGVAAAASRRPALQVFGPADARGRARVDTVVA